MTKRTATAPALIWLIISISLASTSARVVAETGPEPVTIGVKASVRSEILDETRPLIVHLPADYETSDGRYPVLYLLDGDINFHHATGVVEFLSRSALCPSMIVIAIPNTDRARDFAPALATAPPDSPGSARFHEFLKRELIPFVDRTYRTSSYRVLWGHSSTGAFVFFSLARDPELFNSYIAASPSLGRDVDAVMSAAAPALSKHTPSPRRFFACYGGREDERFASGGQALTAMLEESAPSWLTWRLDWYENDNHMSTPHKSLYDSLERTFSAWRVDRRQLIEGGVAALLKQQEQVQREFGGELTIPESVIGPAAMTVLHRGRIEDALALLELNAKQHPRSWLALHGLGQALIRHGDDDRAFALFTQAAPLYPDQAGYPFVLNDFGYELLREEKHEQAIAVFLFAVKNNPNSANAYDSLGEAYMAAGQKELAITNYRKSLELNPDNINAVQMLERLE